jgi:hypothetical protein
MTPGQLVKAVAIALDISEETVTQHDRNLAVAGLRTKGGRGPSAPTVTPLDAARLLVAVLASVKTKDSAEVVAAFEKTVFDPPTSFAEDMSKWTAQGFELPDLSTVLPSFTSREFSTDKFSDVAISALPLDHNFIDAIAALIEGASLPTTDLEEFLSRFAPLRIKCEAPKMYARIGHMDHDGTATYRRPSKSSQGEYKEEPLHKRYARYFGIRQERNVTGSAIMLLGKAFRDDGLPFETTDEALDALLGAQKAPTRAKKRA